MKAIKFLGKITSALVCFLLVKTSYAGVVFYDDYSDYDRAVTSVVVEDFEAFDPNALPTFSIPTSNGINYVGLSGFPIPNVRIAPVGATNFGVPALPSQVLTSRGDENILLTFNSPIFSIGFDTYVNLFGPMVVTVYGTDNTVLDVYSHNHDAGEAGFLGITSTSDVLAISLNTTMGAVVNSGIDNIRLTTAIVPEPNLALPALLLLGFWGVKSLRRRTAEFKS